MAEIVYRVRCELDHAALQRLFAAAWGEEKPGYEAVLARSFTWVTAFEDEVLVGFVNIAWDGGAHFFMVDTTVAPSHQRNGIGSELVRRSIEACRGRGEWMHVDSDAELLEHLYLPAGFRRAQAGIVGLARE